MPAVELKRVFKPGGKLVIVDSGGAYSLLFDPASADRRSVGAKLANVQAARDGNGNIGRQLWRVARSAGLKPIDFEMVVAHSDQDRILKAPSCRRFVRSVGFYFTE